MLTSKLSNCEYFVSANNLILSTMVFFSILTDCNCFNKFMKLFKNWRCTLKDVSLVDSLFWCSKVSSCLILLIFFLSSCSTFLEGKMMRILSVLLMALYLLSCASAYVIYRMGPIYRRPIYRAYYNHDIDDDNIVYLG